VEIRDFPEEWDKDGQPFGAYLNRAGTHSYIRSGVASNWKMLQWLVRTPTWVRQSRQAKALLWQYRALVLIYNIGLLALIVIFFTWIGP